MAWGQFLKEENATYANNPVNAIPKRCSTYNETRINCFVRRNVNHIDLTTDTVWRAVNAIIFRPLDLTYSHQHTDPRMSHTDININNIPAEQQQVLCHRLA